MKGVENHLIARLPRKDRLRLLAECEPVELTLAQTLGEPGESIRNVYFPIDSFASLLTLVTGHPGLEVAMVGREGMLGAELAIGVTTAPLLVVVQGAGSAWRISRSAFGRALASSAALRRGVNLYLHVLTVEMALSAGCLHFHLIGPRLARRLLLTQDRSTDGGFHVTHEHLAHMLGVRRVGITKAAGALQRNGLVQYRRGRVTVIDRNGLEAASCACYGVGRRAYADLLS